MQPRPPRSALVVLALALASGACSRGLDLPGPSFDTVLRDTAPLDSVPRDSAPPEQVPEGGWDHLAVLLVDTGGAAIPDGTKIDGRMEVIRNHDGSLTDLDAAPRAWSGPIGIEIHGSSSTGFPKLSYRVETRDDIGADQEVPLVDLPSESDWVLYGPYTDKTFLRDVFSYQVGRSLGASRGEWQPSTRFVELFLNGAHQGLYVVIERVKLDDDRLDLPDPAATAAEGDLTGGYLVKVDQHRSAGWDTARGTPIDWHDPQADQITAEQDAYLRAYFDGFEALLDAPGWDDPVTGYRSRLDVPSWIDHYLVNELAHNVDAYRLSAYLHKDPDSQGGLLHAGPLWDFNLGYGNVDYCDCWDTAGFVIDSLTTCGYGYQYPFWWSKLLSDPAFQDDLRCRWEELRADELSVDTLLATLDALAAEVAEAEPRDHALWGTLGVYVWPNYYVGQTWDDELRYLRVWIRARVTWLDANLPGTCAPAR